jgi:hypothetical protein
MSVAVFSFVLLASSGRASAAERYFLMVFGSQQIPPRAKYSHSFATFVKATADGSCPQRWCLESHTISWLPQTLEIRVRALFPECGQNLELHATMRWCLATGQRISMWGPYEVRKEIYDAALAQSALLEGGSVCYKVIDTGYRSDVACNCIHAVSSVYDGHRVRVFSPSFGETASWYLTQRFEPWILDCRCRHEWVASGLRLDCYPIIRRDFESPRSNLAWTAFHALTGGDR